MISRRTIAFEANIARVLLKQCCLFTFTLVDTISPQEASKRWTRLLAAMRRYNREWSGVRVYELHPGRWKEFSHGLHVHLVSHVFFSDRVMQRLCKHYGFGRWERKHIFDHQAAYYIGKYLNDKRPGALRGMRLQSCFGPYNWTRLRHIIVDSMRSRCFRACARRSFGDGRNWEDRSWPERLQLVARLQFDVIQHNLRWCPDRQDYFFRCDRPPPSLRRPLIQHHLFDVPASDPPPAFNPEFQVFQIA